MYTIKVELDNGLELSFDIEEELDLQSLNNGADEFVMLCGNLHSGAVRKCRIVALTQIAKHN